MSISRSKRNSGTTWGKENILWPRPRTHARSPSWICCCSTDYAVNPLWSESWVVCVADRVEGKTCNRTYLIIYFLPRTMLAQCSKWSIDIYLCPEWKCIECYKTQGSDTTTLCMYPIYFGGTRSKGFATLRNVSKLTFLGQDWARKVCRFSVFLRLFDEVTAELFWDISRSIRFLWLIS